MEKISTEKRMTMSSRLLICIVLFWGNVSMFGISFKDIPELVDAYRVLSYDEASLEKQADFLEAFPENWIDFLSIFHHYDVRLETYDRLYDQSSEYILTLKKLDKIDPSLLADKLIGLVYGSCWDADAPSHLQNVLHELMCSNADVFFSELEKKPKGMQFDFWSFYWSGLHDNNNFKVELDKLLERMNGKYPHQCRIMSLAYEFYSGGVTFMR